MANILYLLTSVVVTTSLILIIVPIWVRIAFSRGFVGKDMNKLGDVRVAEGGGLWVVISCTFGIYSLATLRRYLSNEVIYNDEFFALTSLLLLTSLLGFIDDILGWKKGLPIWVRVLFIAPISLPLIVIKAGVSTVSIPLVGVVDFGILYPLVLVPIGVLGAANAFNMIAGYNGLEASMGLTLMLFTAIFSYVKGIDLVFECSLIMASALAVFLRFNWYPAKVFPGNTLTYAVGAYYASLVILGNMEKFGVLLYTLYFIEFILFIRGVKDGIYKENFGIPKNDGTLKQPYDKIYSLTHLAIVILEKSGIKPTEVKVTLTLTSLQILVGMIVLMTTLLSLI